MEKTNIDIDVTVPAEKLADVKAHLLEAQKHFGNMLAQFEPKKEQEKFELSFAAECQHIFFDLSSTFEIKNEQYGRHDPLANFRNGAMLQYGNDGWNAMYETAKSYCLKHVAHVFGKGQTINDEKIDESLRDIAVYCVIMQYMADKYKEELYKGVAQAVKAPEAYAPTAVRYDEREGSQEQRR